MSCVIYQIRCLVSGRVYVGSTKALKDRWKHHRSDLRAGKHTNFKLQAAWIKYGENSFVFEILEHCEYHERTAREEYWINERNSFKDGYNCSNKGSGASPETALKVAEANKRRKGVSCGKGVPKSRAHAQAISRALKKAYREGRGPSSESIKAGLARRRQRLEQNK